MTMSAAASSSHSSVVSLNLDEDDSSVAQLDMKCEIIVENNDNSHRSMLPMASIPLPLNSNISESTPGPSFGSVALEECKQVTFGNQHFYQGPVTFVCDKNTIAAVTDARPNRSNNKSCLGLRKQFDRIWQSNIWKFIFIVIIGVIVAAIAFAILSTLMMANNIAPEPDSSLNERKSENATLSNPNETIETTTHVETNATVSIPTAPSTQSTESTQSVDEQHQQQLLRAQELIMNHHISRTHDMIWPHFYGFK